MKRGLPLLVLFILILSMTSVLAQGYGTSGFAGLPSISEIINNEWVNAAIVFLFVFAFVWFVLQQVFKANKGAAIIISIILALVGALGVIYLYGPIIAKFGNLIFFGICAAVILLLWFQFRHAKTIVFIALALSSLIWLLLLRGQLCPPFGILFQELCVILDVIAIILIIILIIRLLWALFQKLRGGAWPTTGRGPTPPPGRFNLKIGVQGNGRTNPAPGNYSKKENSRVGVRAIPGKNSRLDHWELDNTPMGAADTIHIVMDDNHTLIAIFTGFAKKGPSPEQQPQPQGPPRIDFSANPSRVGSGNAVTLNWHASNAERVILALERGKQVLVGLSGSRTVYPLDSVTYTAIAINEKGQKAIAKAHVEVMKALAAPKGEQPKEEVKRKERTARELQHAYNDYKFKIFNTKYNASMRSHMLSAMRIIVQKAREINYNIQGPTPEAIESKLRKNKLL